MPSAQQSLTVLLVGIEDTATVAEAGAKAYPRLGLLALAAWARRHVAGGVDLHFHYADQLLQKLDAEDIGRRSAALGADVVALSGMSHAVVAIKQAAQAVRSRSPRSLIVAGGPYVSSFREAALIDGAFDLVVYDEGEETFAELLTTLAAGDSIDHLPGTIVRDADGCVRTNATRGYIEDLDRLPIPAFDLVDLDAYAQANPHLDCGGRFAPIVTARGCPYRCIYCHALHGKRVRFRSAEATLAEIETLHRTNSVNLFYIYDDIFNFDMVRAKEIFRGVIAARLDVAFDFINGLRGDRMDRELIDLMLDAGTIYCAYAVETATPRIQREIRKNLNLDKLADTVEYTVTAGGERCAVATYNMIGFPGETEAEVENTMAFNCSLPHHIADVAIATPQEGTAMFDIACDHGYVPPALRRTNYVGMQEWSASEYIPPANLQALRSRFHRMFYDPLRRRRLSALAASDGPRSQQRFLGAFVRGYMSQSLSTEEA